MKVVLDTNVVISGLLWAGPSKRLIEFAAEGRLDLFTSRELIVELNEVIRRKKFLDRLQRAGITPEVVVGNYVAFASVVEAPPIAPIVASDPDDDAVIACALAAQADWVVSGDHHLFNLNRPIDIQILSPVQALALVDDQQGI